MPKNFRVTIEQIGADNLQEFDIDIGELRGIQRHIQTRTLMDFDETCIRPFHRLGFAALAVHHKFVEIEGN